MARLSEAEIPTHFLGFYRVRDYFAAVKRLADLLREQRPEILQTFLFHANVVGARAAREAGVPHVVTGIRVADPRWWRTSVERVATAAADRFVCVSQSVADFSRRRGFAAEKLVVIPNGVELDAWQNALPADLNAVGVPAGRRALLYVGRLDKQKGLDRFFHELPSVFRTLPLHDLVLAGNGNLLPALKRLATALGIQDRVHFAGWQAAIEPLMAAADAAALPSAGKECRTSFWKQWPLENP